MRRGLKIALLTAAGIICLLLGMGLGSVSIPISDMISIVRCQLSGTQLSKGIPAITASILWNLRMPRAIMAFLTGAALAVGGAVMQSVLRNPLASGYTLGVSSGASLTSAIAILTGFTLPLLGRYTLALCGFLGGLSTVFLAIGLATQFDKNLENTTVILTGMVLSLFINAILTLVTAFSHEHLQQLVFWQMGSFSGQSWQNCGLLLALLVPCLLVLVRYGREMDLMTFGEEQALSAGVELTRVKLLLIAVAALLTGSAVAFVGVIGFVDLISPHVVRRIFGSNHRLVIPMSALFGGSFMVLADLLARTIVSPRELAVGAVTALVGAPFFASVYFGRRRRERSA